MTNQDNGFRLSRWLVDRYGSRVRDVFNRAVIKSSLIDDSEVFTAERFSYLEPLKAHWRTVRDEADRVLQDIQSIPPLGDVSPDHKRLDYTGKWRAYFLWGYGYRVDRNCEQCPLTASLVDEIPGLLTAMYSVHEPGAHLPRHRGVTKGMLTYHLGLHVPTSRSDCYIQIEDTPYHWREGEFLVFDDTRYHEVFNRSDAPRVILLLHIRRPLGFPGSWLQDLFFWGIRRSPFVQDARHNIDLWAREVDRRMNVK